MNRPLFTIADDLRALADLLTETGGDVTDTDADAAITAWFDELGTERDTKLDHYAALITELEARARMRTEEAKRLLAHATTDTSAAQRLRERLHLFFTTQGLTKVTTARYTLSLMRNGGRPALQYAGPPETLPPRFQRLTVDYNAAAIRDALDQGEALTCAWYAPRGDRLSIR
jgi:hypothetical protein